jgi:putative N6-adenine-specific DNA methylase
MEAGLRACLHSRVAVRVLLELGRFPAPSAEALYEGARALAWADWLDDRTTLAVDATVSSSALAHSGYAALKVKDAVVDLLRERLGRRPDVDVRDPDVRIALHLAADRATLSLDLAGAPLHRRGYRSATTPAPLKETLAAAVLALGRVDPALPFVDPMAGSGTLAIEHALAARRLAPGLGRSFGFQRWPAYRGALQSAFDRMREEARAAALPRAPAPILARDLHPRAVEALRRNVEAAGVAGDVEVERGDARELRPRFPQGTLCTNPPYGERLMARGRGRPGREERPPPEAAEARASRRRLEGFYRGLGDMLARHAGWSAVLLSGSPLLERALPARPQVDHRLWNGPLEVHLLRLRIP